MYYTILKNILLLGALVSSNVLLANNIKTDKYEVSITESGKIAYYIDKSLAYNKDTIDFRTDNYAGFSFDGISLERDALYKNKFVGIHDGILYSLEYKDVNGCLAIDAIVKNTTSNVFIPQTGIKIYLGLNTYMDKFPEWNDIYFPTMLRCEKTHMTSYFMTPKGRIMLVASPDPVASWENEYECQDMIIKGKKITHGLHRIYTSSYYLLHRLPLPTRHPQDLFSLSPEEEKCVRFFIKPVDNIENVQEEFYKLTNAPVLSADLYTISENDIFNGKLWADDIKCLEVRTPRNEVDTLSLLKIGKDMYTWSYKPFSGKGEYTVTAMNACGKISEMKLFVRPDFDYYLSHARKEALRCKPTTTHHAECFYPLYSYFLAKKYIPDTDEDARAEVVYDSIFPVLYDKEKGEMRNGKYRIQDAATMAGILSDRYQITRDVKDLENAASLVEYLIRCQWKDGGYYNPAHKVHYTSVIYIAKSIMEVMNEEKKIAEKSKTWNKIYKRHKASVIKAIDDLASRGDNVETEGQMTFEDGMISCSVAQLGLAALKTTDEKKRQKYLEQAINLNKKHLCLTQSLIPDSRMNGATLRFWEFQYTVNLMHNGLNSPCGWSAWKYYGSWYLYLLTGDYSYMKEVINGLGSCMQLLDYNTGELRFGFLPDPYIDSYQFTETPVGSRNPQLNRVILGEQYISQISSWHYTDPYAWRKTKFGIDNFVHEVYKCMTEVFMENAYIVEIEPGVLKGINCHLTVNDNYVDVKYDSKLVKNLHVNLITDYVINVGNKDYEASGLKWLIGYPDDLQIF